MPKNQHDQRIFFSNNPVMNYGLSKGAESYFQSQFSMSKINGIFSKKEIKKSFKNINLGDYFFIKKYIFLTSIFQRSTTSFSKIIPKTMDLVQIFAVQKSYIQWIS